jgi:hypothetical protein
MKGPSCCVWPELGRGGKGEQQEGIVARYMAIETVPYSRTRRTRYQGPNMRPWACSKTTDRTDTPQPFKENLTGTRGAYKTYSTVVPKVRTWEPVVKARGGAGSA